ncbi:SMI1/KNR4 family protein [Undibacterium pigrum]|uniref:SMI1/KNR4 family protein SUKH-1 n=1 Tax=Undibacterium pigrum TaxID=401470 RepID=A0A318IQP8_9BURK|nr:SMI1/KNR4 family protein [Undibacterium pigrum]PXX37829.1 hypothetical protein DFR42_11579 [Undibacterium pigrum]
MTRTGELIDELLSLCDQIRPGYRESLGRGLPRIEAEQRLKTIIKSSVDIPELFLEIYCQVDGTLRDVADQKVMDFIPGYRLIHIDELEEEFQKFMAILGPSRHHNFPFLANYSSDFVCIESEPENRGNKIGSFLHDDPQFELMHSSAEDFLTTVIAFYRENVYFLDADGFLDYDFDKQAFLGNRLNNGILYWQ